MIFTVYCARQKLELDETVLVMVFTSWNNLQEFLVSSIFVQSSTSISSKSWLYGWSMYFWRFLYLDFFTCFLWVNEFKMVSFMVVLKLAICIIEITIMIHIIVNCNSYILINLFSLYILLQCIHYLSTGLCDSVISDSKGLLPSFSNFLDPPLAKWWNLNVSPDDNYIWE